MNQQQIEKWAQTRQLGPWKYALIYGSIWGFFVVAFVFILNSFLHFDNRMSTGSGILLMVAIYWVTGIILYRFIIWKAKEKVYQNWLNSQK